MDSNQKDKKLGLFRRLPLCSKEKKKKDVGGIMTGVSVRKVLTMFVRKKRRMLLFFSLKEREEGFLRRAWDL